MRSYLQVRGFNSFSSKNRVRSGSRSTHSCGCSLRCLVVGVLAAGSWFDCEEFLHLEDALSVVGARSGLLHRIVIDKS